MARYVGVAVAGPDPIRLARSFDGTIPGKMIDLRRCASAIIVLCQVGPEVTRDDIVCSVRVAAGRIVTPRTHVSMGVSGPRRGHVGAHIALIEAGHALVIGRALKGDGSTTDFDDLGAYRFILGRPPSEIRAFCERALGPLVRESERHAELTRTLEEYLKAQGGRNAIARALLRHRNTVRRRIQRIAQLTGADLSSADDRLILHLALLGSRTLARLEAWERDCSVSKIAVASAIGVPRLQALGSRG